MDQITELLKAAQAGDKQAFEDLFGLVYAELHRLAVIRMAGESPGHTLQPTALVHEVWLKFHSGSAQGVSQITGHGHFLAVAARAMRQILIDHARRKLSLKRGSNSERVDLNEIDSIVFKSFADTNGNGIFDLGVDVLHVGAFVLGDVPIDGLVMAKEFDQVHTNVTPEAKYTAAGFFDNDNII